MDRPSSLLHGPTAPPSPPPPPPPPSLHGPALLLVTTVFPPGGFAIPCRYALHHPYICPCFWRKHFLHTHKGGSLCVLGICQLVGHRLVMPLLLRPQLVMHWLVMHALAKDSPGWPGDVSVTDYHVCMQFTWKITVHKQRIVVRS